jgi:hypothetical protein
MPRLSAAARVAPGLRCTGERPGALGVLRGLVQGPEFDISNFADRLRVGAAKLASTQISAPVWTTKLRMNT